MSNAPETKTAVLPADSSAFRSRNKSFARRGRALPPRLQRIWEEHGPNYLIDVRRDLGETSVAAGQILDLPALFGRENPIRVEIGSGVGDQVIAAAQAAPEWDHLCFEVWVPGLARILSWAVDTDLTNIRMVEADAALALAAMVPTASITEVWTFFPDPWRKARHHKRRLVQPAFAWEVARILRPGGKWRLATDWDSYAWQMRDVVADCPAFTNPHAGQRPDPQDPAGAIGGFAPRWEGRILTRFEKRGLDAGRVVRDVLGVRTETPWSQYQIQAQQVQAQALRKERRPQPANLDAR